MKSVLKSITLSALGAWHDVVGARRRRASFHRVDGQ